MGKTHTPTREFEVKHPLLDSGDTFKFTVSKKASRQATYMNLDYMKANMDTIIEGHASSSLVNSEVAQNQPPGNLVYITHVHMDVYGIVYKTDDTSGKGRRLQ